MHDRKSACFTVFLLALTLAFPRLLTAQSQSTSALTGTVTDSTGAVIPGATVSITSPSLIGGTHSDGDRQSGCLPLSLVAAGRLSADRRVAGVPHRHARRHPAATGPDDYARRRAAAGHCHGNRHRFGAAKHGGREELCRQHTNRQRAAPESSHATVPAGRHQPRARHHQQCGLRRHRQLQRAADRRRRRQRPGRRVAVVVLQLQLDSGSASGRPRCECRVRRVHRRRRQ